MPIFDFLCDKCGEAAEKITKSDVESIVCECGGTMQKQLSMPRIELDGTNPDFPGAYDKWGRDREKRAAAHRKKSYYEG